MIQGPSFRVGIISGNYAKNFGYSTTKIINNEKMVNLCVIRSEGTDSALTKSLKQGNRFKFNAGAVIKLSFNMDEM
jgi:hypothetical protein